MKSGTPVQINEISENCVLKEEILKALKEQNRFLSGQELCEKFQVSRTAIWKVINQLKEEGYEIESVSRKGYRLKSHGDLMNQFELDSTLNGHWAGKTVKYFEVTDSTNTQVKRYAEEGAPHGFLAVAEEQTAGKGRRGREWFSPKGGNLYFSLLLRPNMPPEHASALTLVMALSVVQAMRKIGCHDASIKWPNDIVLNGKKVCGILTEMSAEMDFIHYVVIGVGINVGVEQFQDDIKAMAISLSEATGKGIRRVDLLAVIMERFEENYALYESTEDFSKLKETYEQYLLNKDVAVKVLEPKGEYIGIARGINSQGELLVEKEDGRVVQVYAGEVSVRGVYGYV